MKTTQDIADLSSKYSHTIGYVILAIVAVALLAVMIREANKKRNKDKQ